MITPADGMSIIFKRNEQKKKVKNFQLVKYLINLLVADVIDYIYEKKMRSKDFFSRVNLFNNIETQSCIWKFVGKTNFIFIFYFLSVCGFLI